MNRPVIRFVGSHEDLLDVQGGAAGDHQHLTSSQVRGFSLGVLPLSASRELVAADFANASRLTVPIDLTGGGAIFKMPTPASIGRAVSVEFVLRIPSGNSATFEGVTGPPAATYFGGAFTDVPALNAAGQRQIFTCDPTVSTTDWF